MAEGLLCSVEWESSPEALEETLATKYPEAEMSRRGAGVPEDLLLAYGKGRVLRREEIAAIRFDWSRVSPFSRRVLKELAKVPYGKSIAPGPGVTAAFLDAGHILGSAIVTVTVADEGKEKKLVFSGDLGHRGLPIVRDPASVQRADALVIESTYGNRIHKGMEDTVEEFVHAVEALQLLGPLLERA